MPDRLRIRRIGSSVNDAMAQRLDLAFDRALARESLCSEFTLNMVGMSGQIYRHFINNLTRVTPSPRYLEVGSWTGSTACAVMDMNAAKVLCIDNWSLFGGPKDIFHANIETVKNPSTDFSFIESDFRAVDASAIGKFNMYMYDGPHEKRDQYDGLALYANALENEIYFFVDDWNWPEVRRGTEDAIVDTGYQIDYYIEVRTTLNEEHTSANTPGDGSDWHNGYFLSKLSRKKSTLGSI